MEREIEFSIIVPVYNASKYLEDCVSSILKQNHRSFEIILVDDGSTDSSPQLCDAYAAEHHCVRVIHKQNSGPLHSRRIGLSNAVGEWIIYLDSDDRLGEIAAAIVEIKEGYSCTEDEINEFCKGMPRYKRPRKIIFADIPRNPTGKIEKPVLRERYCHGRLVEEQTNA